MTIIDNVTYNGLELKMGLGEGDLKAIRELAKACEEHDGYPLKLNWRMLESRAADAKNDALYYEDGRLVGFAGLYAFFSAEVELSGMVHPSARGRGIFRQLADAMEGVARERDFLELIYICPRASASGKRFLQARGVPYSFSEYVMERDDNVAPASAITPTPALEGTQLKLRQAGKEELALLVELNSIGFNMSMEEALDMASNTLSASELAYVAELEGRAIGKINVLLKEDHAFLLGFLVRPEDRGRGLGKAILSGLLDRLRDERGLRRFALEVAVDNERALGLYESCGFRTANVIDYYKMKLN